MKEFLQNFSRGLFFFFLLIFVFHNLHAQNFEWAKKMGGVSDDIGFSVASDNNGNVYVIGHFADSIEYDSGNVASLLISKGFTDVFIAKMNAAGDVLWVKGLGGLGSEMGRGIAVDTLGNIYITGTFTGALNVTIGSTIVSLYASNYSDSEIFVCKLDQDGNFQWAKQMGGSKTDIGNAIAVDRMGNVFVTGIFNATAVFGPGPGAVLTALSSSADVFVTKMDTDGNLQWVKQMGGAKQDVGNDLTVDENGNVYVVGNYTERADFSPATTSTFLTAVSGIDIFIAKLNTNGDLKWVRSMGGNGGDYGRGIALDPFGHVYTVGYFNGIADFDPGPNTYNLSGDGQTTTFVSKLDSNGSFVWAKRLVGSEATIGYSIAADPVGNVFTTGSFRGETDFNPGADSFLLSSKTDFSNIFISKLNSNGDFAWARSLGGIATDQGEAIVLDPDRNVYTVGSFSEVVNFNTGSNTTNLQSKGNRDAFIHKLSCGDTSLTILSEVSDCFGFTLRDTTYTESGVYFQKFMKSTGCDSTVELHLSILDLNPTITIKVRELSTAIPYHTYQWMMNGTLITGAINQIYHVTTNGDYQVIVTNENDCLDTSDIYRVNNIDEVNIKNRAIQPSDIQLYPNPTNRIVYIQSPINVDIILTDVLGHSFMKIKNPEQIDLNELSTGVYFIQIYDRNGVFINSKKVIKTQ